MEKQEKAAIEALLKEYQDALSTSSAEKSAGLYAKEGLFMSSEASSANGTENIRKAYQCIFSRIRRAIDFHIHEISIEGDFAFAVTSSEGQVPLRASNTTAPEETRELFIFEKKEGKWEIAHHMFNTFRGSPPSASSL